MTVYALKITGRLGSSYVAGFSIIPRPTKAQPHRKDISITYTRAVTGPFDRYNPPALVIIDKQNALGVAGFLNGITGDTVEAVPV